MHGNEMQSSAQCSVHDELYLEFLRAPRDLRRIVSVTTRRRGNGTEARDLQHA